MTGIWVVLLEQTPQVEWLLNGNTKNINGTYIQYSTSEMQQGTAQLPRNAPAPLKKAVNDMYKNKKKKEKEEEKEEMNKIEEKKDDEDVEKLK